MVDSRPTGRSAGQHDLHFYVAHPQAAQVTNIPEGVGSFPPFWSADGSRVFYAAGGDLWNVSAAGGLPKRILADIGGSAALSPDGKNLVLGRTTKEGKWQLLVSSPPGVEPKPLRDVPVFSGGGARVLPFAPNGSRLGVVIDAAAWIVPFPIGRPQRLQIPGAASLSWFPDGRHVLAAVTLGPTGYRLAIADSETNAMRPILAAPEVIGRPTLSSDGRRIVYSTGLADWDIFEFTIEGRRVRPLVATSRPELGVQWSPSGDQFLYSTDASGSPALWTRSADGRRGSPLVTGLELEPGVFGTFARFSPDGRRVAYMLRNQIWTIPATGGRPAVIATAPYGATIQHLDWSPDGNWIVFTKLEGDTLRIGGGARAHLEKISSSGGAEPVPIRDFASPLSSAATLGWSPDGRWIAYSARDGRHLIAPDGTGDRLLGYWGATEQKTHLRIQATSSATSEGLRSGRNSPR
jgi:Tol biopolymer transport system component